MPELPEVETIKRRLAEVLPGKTIKVIEILHPKSFVGDSKHVINQSVVDVTRRAKILIITFPTTSLLIHLKMTGQLIYIDKHSRLGGGHPTADFVTKLPSKHTRVVLTFTDESRLFFNDQRIFGWIKVVDSNQLVRELDVLGPDITDEAVTTHYLQERFSRRSVPIKQAIMMNEIVCGVGNIYASDALNVAQISPLRPAHSLSIEELSRLLTAMHAVIAEAIELGGTTFDGKYVTIDGLTGSYQERLKAYGRAGEECYQCGGEIVKTTLGGRGTYFCSRCQAL